MFATRFRAALIAVAVIGGGLAAVWYASQQDRDEGLGASQAERSAAASSNGTTSPRRERRTRILSERSDGREPNRPPIEDASPGSRHEIAISDLGQPESRHSKESAEGYEESVIFREVPVELGRDSSVIAVFGHVAGRSSWVEFGHWIQDGPRVLVAVERVGIATESGSQTVRKPLLRGASSSDHFDRIRVETLPSTSAPRGRSFPIIRGMNISEEPVEREDSIPSGLWTESVRVELPSELLADEFAVEALHTGIGWQPLGREHWRLDGARLCVRVSEIARSEASGPPSSRRRLLPEDIARIRVTTSMEGR